MSATVLPFIPLAGGRSLRPGTARRPRRGRSRRSGNAAQKLELLQREKPYFAWVVEQVIDEIRRFRSSVPGTKLDVVQKFERLGLEMPVAALCVVGLINSMVSNAGRRESHRGDQ